MNLTVLQKYTGNSHTCTSSEYQATFSLSTQPGDEPTNEIRLAVNACKHMTRHPNQKSMVLTLRGSVCNVCDSMCAGGRTR